MPQEKIIIKFEAKGQPALVQAINGLTKAQDNLKNGIVGATTAGDHAKVQSAKLSQVTLRLTAQLAAQGKTWTDIGVKTSVVSKAMRGNQIAIEKLRNSYKTANTTTRILGGSFAVLRSKLLLVSFASTMVATTIGRLTKLFGEQEKAEKKLEIQLGGVSRELLKFASAQQQVTRFGDEVTISAMATAAAYTKNQDQIKGLMKSAMDLSVFLDQDLNATVTLLSKSIFSSTNQLSRYGVSFEGAVGTSARFENALQAVQERAGGLATGEAATLNFALDQMGNAVGDLGENLGTVFVPLVMASAKGVKAFAEFMDENRVKSYTSALLAGAGAYGVYAIATGKAAKAMLVFNKISKKNIAMLAAMVIVSEIIENFELFGDETGNLEDELNNLNNTTKVTLAQQQALDLSNEKLLLTQSNLTSAEIQRELIQVRLKQLTDQLNAGIITRIQYEEQLNNILIERVANEEALFTQKINNINEVNSAISSATSLFSKNVNDQMQIDLAATKNTSEYKRAMARGDKDTMEKLEKDAKNKHHASLVAAFRMEQATSIANIIMSFAQAHAKTFAQLGIIGGLASMPVLSALTALQVGLVAAQAPPAKFARGGMIGGRRHSQGGTMIEAEQGEFVMSRSAVQSVGIENLNRMNEGGGGSAVTVNVSGNVLSQDFVEGELAENIKEAIRRGTDFGIS